MRVRVLVAAALAAAVAVSLPAQAGPKVLDGKKVKKLSFKATSGPQAEGNTGSPLLTTEQRAACKPPRCARFDFVYKPAKGVTGDVLVQLKWSVPVTDIDLFLVNTKKKTVMASCGAGAGTSETVVVSGKSLKTGTTYTLVADFYQTPGDTVNGLVEFPTKFKPKETVPADADGLIYNFNCGLQN